MFAMLDGMDEGKIPCPRYLDGGKSVQATWRPQLHFMGCVIGGCLEHYTVSEPDLAKDSNNTLTTLVRAIDLATREYGKRNLDVPEHFALLVDNTARENRNTFIMTFAAILVATNRFRSFTLLFFLVGHTHNRMDKRFGTLGHRISLAKTLQDPEEFREHLR